MDPQLIKKLLMDVREGTLSIDEAISRLKKLPFEDLDYAKVDHHRSLRKGFPEVVWGEGKTPDQICGIIKRMVQTERTVMASRISPQCANLLMQAFPHGNYLEIPRLFVIERGRLISKTKGTILIISAGTADLPVAEEAYWTAHYMGNEVAKMYDVGVAGIHRLFHGLEKIHQASVIIVVAGMEGALVSVVGGIAGVPVIGVPTSVGYGVNLSGLTTLFAMLSSCSSGVTVVNIDNGFGAAYAATLMNRLE